VNKKKQYASRVYPTRKETQIPREYHFLARPVITKTHVFFASLKGGLTPLRTLCKLKMMGSILTFRYSFTKTTNIMRSRSSAKNTCILNGVLRYC